MSGLSQVTCAPEGGPYPPLAIGGLLSNDGRLCHALYDPVVNDGLDWDLPPRDLYIPLPDGGRREPEETRKRLEEEILARVQKLGRPAVIAAHSLGAHFTKEVLLDNPEAATAVVLTAGVDDGQKYETPLTVLLRHLAGNPAYAGDIKYDSKYMVEHRERVAAEWPEQVGLHVISTVCDNILPFVHGLNIQVPEGQEVHSSVLSLPLPGAASIIKLFAHNRKVNHMGSWRPASHVDIIRHPELIKYVRRLQRITDTQAEPAAVAGIGAKTRSATPPPIAA
jgi:pimeloyl-ACP methyl ester carboxylesterase